MKHHRRTQIASAAAAMFVISLSPRLAMADADTQAPQRVIVTGSNIKRVEVETADPVLVITREDIARSGVNTLDELLETLPSTTGSLQDTSGDTSFAGGASAVAMRNLGSESTLVLLNGRRVAPYALPNYDEVFANIDALPLDAIDRIEILKSGASAIYGSDAVAGVINVITRSDYRGIEAGASTGRSLTSHSFGETTFHASAGFGDLASDHYNLIANVEHHHRDSVMWRQVFDHMSAQSRALIPQGTGELTPYSFPGNVALQSVAGCDPSRIVNGLCMYDWYSGAQAVPAADRTNALVSARALVKPGVEAFAEFLGASTRTTYREQSPTIGASDSDVWANPSTGALESFHTFPLPATHPLNTTGAPADIRYMFADAKASRESDSDNYRLVTGLRGTGGLYEWESALSLLGSDTSQLENARGLSMSGFSRMIGGTTDTSTSAAAVDPNYFNIPGGYRIGGPNSPQVLDALFPQIGTHGKLKQASWDGKVSGELAQLDAGPVGFATGFDLRHERWTVRPTANLLSGDIVNWGATEVDATRSHGAVFSELDVPLAKAIDSQWAARVDKFPGFGAHLSPKVGLRLQPSSSVLLRGTIEGGFRAPNVVEAAPTKAVSFVGGIVDPQRCRQASAYSSDLMAQANALPDSDPNKTILTAHAQQVYASECSETISDVTTNNPSLKPEVSRTYTLGLMIEPKRGTTFTLDYWNIQRKNEITTLTDQALINEEDALPPGVAVTRASLTGDRTFPTAALQQQYGVTAGALTGVRQQFANVSRTRTDGIDFGVKSTVATSWGALETDLNGTLLDKFQSYSTDRHAYGDNLAGRYGYSRLVATLSEALTTGSFVNGLKLTYYSGTSLQGDYYDTAWSPDNCASNLQIAASDCRVGDYLMTDYFVSYNGIRNLTLGAYVGNLFAKQPPFDRRAMEDGGRTYPQLGEVSRRTLQVSMNYKFR
jgi:iron complex outermembrane receptor protein